MTGIRQRLTAGCAICAAVATYLASGSTSWAGGFFVPFQSGQAIGTALAGSSARSDDASFMFFNPATIADLPGGDLTADARLFIPSIRIDASQATSPLGADLTAGGGSGEMTSLAGAPGAFAAIPLSKDLWIGLGGSAPFATDIKANPDWAGRFHLLETKMLGINLTAAVAYRITEWLTLAGGAQVQKFTAEFAKMELIPTPFGFAEARGYLDGEDWATGYVAGILIKPAPGTRIGMGYRSQLTHTLKGTAGADLPGIPSDRATFDLNLPQVVSLGIEQQLGPQWRLFAEAQWIDWSRFTGFDIAFGSGRPNELRPQSWDDTWMGAIGLGVRIDPLSEITAGIQYDTPVTDGGGNTLSPDGARTMVGIGFSRVIEGRGLLSLHYAHVFFDDAPVEASGPTSGTLSGTFKGSLDIIGLSMRMDW